MGKASGEPVYEVQNVVVTSQLAPSFNLLRITKHISGAVYEPGKFPALRLKKFGVGFLLYSSGKIVCTGSKTPDAAKEKIGQLCDELGESGIKTHANPKIHIRNIVASVDLKKELRLHELAYMMDDSEYNPEYFPGMKIKVGNTRILVFRTGKAIVPGLKSVDEVEKTVNWLKNRLEKAEAEIAQIKE